MKPSAVTQERVEQVTVHSPWSERPGPPVNGDDLGTTSDLCQRQCRCGAIGIHFLVTRWVWRALGYCLTLVLSGEVGAQTADGMQRWAFTTLSTVTEGSILSSPAEGPDGTVYIGVEVGSATNAAPSGRLFALDSNGGQKWVFTASDWVDSTPAIGADGTIYFGDWNGLLYALRPDGTTRWEYRAGAFITSSPAVAPDGTIYVGANSDLVAFNPDGTPQWFFAAGDWIDSSPAVGPDGTIIFGSWDGQIYALAPDGNEKWRFPTAGTITGSPAIAADGTIYLGSRDAYLYALASDGSLKWSFDTRDTIESSPALGADGTIYLTSTGGRLFALNSDGSERWVYPPANQAPLLGIYSSPAVRADGSIVFGTSNNAVHALRPDGTLLWQTPLGDWSDSSPLVAIDGTIYIGCGDKKLYSLTGTSEPLATDWPQFRRNPWRSGWQPMGAMEGTNGRMVNLSVRTLAGSDASTLIVGFVVGGTGTRTLLLRGVGPTLERFGVSGVLPNPRLSSYAGTTELAANEDWSTGGNASLIAATANSVGAFPLPAGSLDAALLGEFPARDYTVQIVDGTGVGGVALMEAYDAGGSADARLVNVSARGGVTPGAGVLIAGVVVTGSSRAILLRGVGPALESFGVPSVLARPRLRVFQGSRIVAENKGWSTANVAVADVTAAALRVGAFPLAVGSGDAALLLTLPPGPFTVQVSGDDDTVGIALIEIYEVP